MKAMLAAAFVAAFLCGCAGTVTGSASPAAAPEGPQQVSLVASNFKFMPNRIKVAAGRPAKVTVTNGSHTDHNITVLDTKGEKLAATDLPALSTQTLTFTPLGPGRYAFYCDKFGHSTLGMTGEFVAER